MLLSAFCVKSAERGDPYALQFQYAKKQMEEKLREQSDLTYSIIRPTAFFKSVSGQLEVVDSGAPFVYFDLGKWVPCLLSCSPLPYFLCSHFCPTLNYLTSRPLP